MRFWKSYICSSKLDVQEANISFTQLTESEIIFGNTTQNHDRTEKLVVCRDKNHVRHQSRGVINVLDNVDLALSNVLYSHHEALLHVFEDNEAVIKMIIKGVPQ